jgi:hypothetical protein
MPPRASRKTLPPAAASESHLSAGHKHKKSAPKNKNSKKKDEKESNKSNKKGDKAIGMRKSPPKSSGYESDEHVAAAATTLAYQDRYGDKEDKEEESSNRMPRIKTSPIIYYRLQKSLLR